MTKNRVSENIKYEQVSSEEKLSDLIWKEQDDKYDINQFRKQKNNGINLVKRNAFPQCTLAGYKLQFVERRRYLGHIIVCVMRRTYKERLRLSSLERTYCADVLTAVRFK